MANEYLVNIHRFLTEKLQESEGLAKDCLDRGDLPAHHLHRGELAEFKRLRQFLDENFNLVTQKYH